MTRPWLAASSCGLAPRTPACYAVSRGCAPTMVIRKKTLLFVLGSVGRATGLSHNGCGSEAWRCGLASDLRYQYDPVHRVRDPSCARAGEMPLFGERHALMRIRIPALRGMSKPCGSHRPSSGL